MIERKVVEPAHTGRAVLIVFALKMDGTLRLCVNYGRLNELTERDIFLLPRINIFIDSRDEPTVYLSLDASNAYWHVNFYKNSVKKQLLLYITSFVDDFVYH